MLLATLVDYKELFMSYGKREVLCDNIRIASGKWL